MGFEEPTCSLTNWLEDFGHCSLGRARNVQKITGGWPQSLSSPDLGSGIGRGDVLASTPWVQWKGPACCPAAWPNPSADAGHCEFQGKQSTTSYQMHSNAIIVSILQSYYSHTSSYINILQGGAYFPHNEFLPSWPHLTAAGDQVWEFPSSIALRPGTGCRGHTFWIAMKTMKGCSAKKCTHH